MFAARGGITNAFPHDDEQNNETNRNDDDEDNDDNEEGKKKTLNSKAQNMLMQEH